MKLVFTPTAERQADQKDTWWRDYREKAPDLFARELAEARDLLVATPGLGSPYTTASGRTVRRLLLPKTRSHLYFEVDEASEVIVILAVWGAPRGRPPVL